jgi:UDP-glucose 4-epimerase
MYDFARLLEQLRVSDVIGSPLARIVGAKGYHSTVFDEGPYPVEL